MSFLFQILREINFGDFKSAKSAILTDLEAMNSDLSEILHLLKAEISQINKIQSPRNGKKQQFLTPSRVSKIDFT